MGRPETDSGKLDELPGGIHDATDDPNVIRRPAHLAIETNHHLADAVLVTAMIGTTGTPRGPARLPRCTVGEAQLNRYTVIQQQPRCLVTEVSLNRMRRRTLPY